MKKGSLIQIVSFIFWKDEQSNYIQQEVVPPAPVHVRVLESYTKNGHTVYLCKTVADIEAAGISTETTTVPAETTVHVFATNVSGVFELPNTADEILASMADRLVVTVDKWLATDPLNTEKREKTDDQAKPGKTEKAAKTEKANGKGNKPAEKPAEPENTKTSQA